MTKICTATSRISIVLSFMMAVDPEQKLFSMAEVQFADPETHHKHLGGTIWRDATQQLPERMHGGVAIILDDKPQAWPLDHQQQQAVGPGALAAAFMVKVPGIGLLQLPGNAPVMVSAAETMQVGKVQKADAGCFVHTSFLYTLWAIHQL